jgi:hypothetical protein
MFSLSLSSHNSEILMCFCLGDFHDILARYNVSLLNKKKKKRKEKMFFFSKINEGMKENKTESREIK